jgi:hypothetical protein
VRYPACSAAVQQFTLGKRASSVLTNAAAFRRGSTRRNRCANSPDELGESFTAGVKV